MGLAEGLDVLSGEVGVRLRCDDAYLCSFRSSVLQYTNDRFGEAVNQDCLAIMENVLSMLGDQVCALDAVFREALGDLLDVVFHLLDIACGHDNSRELLLHHHFIDLGNRFEDEARLEPSVLQRDLRGQVLDVDSQLVKEALHGILVGPLDAVAQSKD